MAESPRTAQTLNLNHACLSCCTILAATLLQCPKLSAPSPVTCLAALPDLQFGDCLSWHSPSSSSYHAVILCCVPHGCQVMMQDKPSQHRIAGKPHHCCLCKWHGLQRTMSDAAAVPSWMRHCSGTLTAVAPASRCCFAAAPLMLPKLTGSMLLCICLSSAHLCNHDQSCL